jgi:AcrR family transcriptional regulator
VVARRRRGTEERRTELLEAARALFVREGFTEVSVSRIVRQVGVAQGTFYYYFESKEAVLDALLAAHVDDVVQRLEAISSDPTLDPCQALQAMVRAEFDHGAERARELGAIPGADAHAKLLAGTVRALAPLYAAMIRRGQRAKRFGPARADLLGETLALMAHTLFDQELFGWTDAEYARRRKMLAELFGLLLGVPDGLDFGTRAPRTTAARRPRRR